MYKGKKVLCIIPARGGSKGVPGKNIKNFCGKPLIAWAIEKAKNCNYIDRLIVSTDCENIANVARKFSAEVPFMRDIKLAQDSSPMVPVIIEAIKKMGETYDYAIMLQANSPLTHQSTVDKVLEKLVDEDLDVVFTVCETGHPPQWTLKINDNKIFYAFYGDDYLPSVARQKEDKLYRATAAVYAVKIDALLKKKETIRLALPSKDQKSGAIITDEFSAADIDTELDYYIAETIYRKIYKGEIPC
ncbi:MAG: hypothetical protein A2Y25_01600 [Candidatus Melainabacteria bacterium GWF2_37_15]|nr:MAG: hypothetical protein A2Y25_01600 [Candidatus Melainabacteria bacterium GWF2_37_15]